MKCKDQFWSVELWGASPRIRVRKTNMSMSLSGIGWGSLTECSTHREALDAARGARSLLREHGTEACIAAYELPEIPGAQDYYLDTL